MFYMAGLLDSSPLPRPETNDVKPGNSCYGLYSEDGRLYHAEVTSIEQGHIGSPHSDTSLKRTVHDPVDPSHSKDLRSVIVRYSFYGNSEKLPLYAVLPIL